MTRADLISRMHRAGLRLDDAALAAQVAITLMTRERDRLVIAARLAGLSVRQAARVFGLSKTHIARVSHGACGDGTPACGTMQPPEKGRASPCPQSHEFEPGSN